MRPCLMSQKNILLTFKGFCMNFSLELKKNILSHPVTSKQPHKIVQILMRHPVQVGNFVPVKVFKYFLWLFWMIYGSLIKLMWKIKVKMVWQPNKDPLCREVFRKASIFYKAMEMSYNV